jgi:FkbM family methyltransferase
MKQHTTIKDNKWVWPIIDESSWKGQQDCQTLPQFLLPYVENKNIMVQAGGNCGFLLSHFVPHFETIYTFEPDPINFYCLNQNIDDPRVIKIQGCLGNNTTPVNVQQLIRENTPHDIGGVHISGKGLTPVFRIDDLNLPTCDLIQLDIEGYEYEALLGAIKTIKKYKPVLCVEMHDGWLNRYGATQDKITNLLSQYGYEYVFTHQMDKFFVVKK